MKIYKDRTIIGMGYDLIKGDPEDIKEIFLMDSERSGHIFGMGTTRFGKTRLMESMIEQDLRKGNSIIFIDPKSDYEIFSKIVQVAFEENREDEIMYLSVIPDYSIKFNPLSHFLIPDEMVHHTVSGIEAKDQFFINVAYETSLAIASSLYMIKQANHNEEQLNFSDILYYVSQTDMKDLRNTLEKSIVEPKYAANQRTMLHLLDQIIASPTDYFSKVSTTLRTMLTQLTSGNMGTVMGLSRENPVIDRLEAGKRIILVVHTHALSTRKVSYLMARNVLSSIQSFVGRVFEEGLKINPPLCLYIDEASNVFYDGIENMFNKAGGAGVWLAAFTQSVSDITAELGIDKTKKIIDNTNTKIYLRVNDPDTQKFVSQSSGLVKGYSHVIGLGGSFNLKQEEPPLVSTDIIGNLKKREMLFLGPDGRYKGMTLFTKPSYVNITNKREEETNQAISSISQESGRLDLSDKTSGNSGSFNNSTAVPPEAGDWMWDGRQDDKPAPSVKPARGIVRRIFDYFFTKKAA